MINARVNDRDYERQVEQFADRVLLSSLDDGH